ncbi:MAG: hypothetical protein HY706_18845 [Candidatus Hydrogenedentes bacterium]|nr:hypothetical protein [Candidatus Hydrogenedentota bacterium]
MEFLKRFTELLTPPPFRKTPKPEPASWYDSGPDFAAQIKPLLKALATYPSLEIPSAKDTLAEFKRLAMEKGLYLTAYEIKTQLDSMPRLDRDGAFYHKHRGYVLAADFFLGHIRREIAAVKAKSQPMGRNIFKGYCTEMVGCLLRGENPRRAIEIPVLVLDELLAAAVDSPNKGDLVLDLALQALAGTDELISQFVEQQFAEAIKSTPPGSRHLGNTPQPRSSSAALGEAVVRYLDDLQEKVAKLVPGFAQWNGLAQSPECPPSAQAMLERLFALLEVADVAGYLAFSALVRERIGLWLQQDPAGKGRGFLAKAGELIEEQADQDAALYFHKLSGVRYKRAHDIFARLGNMERAEKVRAKMAALASQGHSS